MHRVLRVANLVWLIYSIVMVEFTLNFNNIAGVLGGRDGNALSNPGQLLPFLVGLFGFTGTLYTLAREKFFPEAIEESEKALIIGAMSGTAQGPSRTSSGLDKQQEKRSIFIRYLVAWMPWLSLLQRFDDELVVYGVSRESTFVGDGSPLLHGSARG
ncbi:hypothetical protein AUP68_16837 [Ilyonectria robusta]